MTVETALTLTVDESRRATVTDVGRGFSGVVLRYGFSESPHVPAALETAGIPDFDSNRATYFLSRPTLIPTRTAGMPMWQEHRSHAWSAIQRRQCRSSTC